MSEILTVLVPGKRDMTPDGQARHFSDDAGEPFQDIFGKLQESVAVKAGLSLSEPDVAIGSDTLSPETGYALDEAGKEPGRALNASFESLVNGSFSSVAPSSVGESDALRDPQVSPGSMVSSLLEAPSEAGLGEPVRVMRPPGSPVGDAASDAPSASRGAAPSGVSMPDIAEDVALELDVPIVRVVKNETHFKPMIDGFVDKIESQAPEITNPKGSEVAAQPKIVGGPAGVVPNFGPAVVVQRPAQVLPSGKGGTLSTAISSEVSQAEPPALAVSAPATVAKAVAAGSVQVQPVSPKGGTYRDIPGDGTSTGVVDEPGAEIPQVADNVRTVTAAISNEAGRPVAQLPRPAFIDIMSPTFAIAAKASEAVARLVTVQLHPADLGLVTVSLKLEGDVLELRLEVVSDEAAAVLNREKDALCVSLRASGYKPEVVTIQVNPASGSSEGAFQQGRNEHAGQMGDREGAPGQSSGGGRQRTDGGRSQDEGKDAEDVDARRIAGGLYL